MQIKKSFSTYQNGYNTATASSIAYLYFAILVSLVFSLVLCNHSVLNTDAYIYFKATNLIIAGDFRASMQVITWPGYTLLLAAIKQLTPLELDQIVYGLNFLSSASLLVIYWRWLALLDLSLTARKMALLLLLLHPTLNGFRDMAVRDYPYWALLMGSLYTLFLYQRQSTLWRCFMWNLLMMMSVALRLEGMIFWMLAPIGLLFSARHDYAEQLKQIVKLQLPLILAAGVVLLKFGILQSSDLNYLIRIEAFLNGTIIQTITTYARAIADQLPQHVHYPRILALIFAFLILFSYLAIKFVKTLNIMFLALVIWGRANTCLPKATAQRRLLLWCILLALVIPLGYYFQQLIVSSRFLVPSLLLLLVIAAPALEKLWRLTIRGQDEELSTCHVRARFMDPAVKPRDDGRDQDDGSKLYLPPKVIQTMIVLTVIWFAADSLISIGTSKIYYREAGTWLAQQVSVGTAHTLSNTVEASFYARKKIIAQQTQLSANEIIANIGSQELDNYDYLLLKTDATATRQARAQLKLLQRQLPHLTWKEFVNRKEDQVIVIKLTE